MLHRIATLCALAGLAFAGVGTASADTYIIDTSHTHVVFKVKHLGISSVTGRFETFAGSFEFDPKKMGAASASVTIDAASINTDVEDRDKHLRTPDFFDVEKFPQITFKSTKVQNMKEGKFQLVGDLTMHGVTKPVTLDVELGGMATDPWGNERVAFSAETTVNRKDFGLTWNKLLETGGLVVGEEVKIMLDVEGIKAKG